MVDLFLIAPPLIYIGLKKTPLTSLERILLVIYGVATFYYNYKNFRATNVNIKKSQGAEVDWNGVAKRHNG